MAFRMRPSSKMLKPQTETKTPSYLPTFNNNEFKYTHTTSNPRSSRHPGSKSGGFIRQTPTALEDHY